MSRCRALPAQGISAGEEIPRSSTSTASPSATTSLQCAGGGSTVLGEGPGREQVSPGSCVSEAQVTVAS